MNYKGFTIIGPNEMGFMEIYDCHENYCGSGLDVDDCKLLIDLESEKWT